MKKSKNKERCVLTAMVKNNINLVNRHITVLKSLQRKQPMGINELSEIAGYPKHKIRYSLQVLEQEGLIEPSVQGAVTTAYSELLKKLE